MFSSGTFSRVPRTRILFVDDDADTRLVYRTLAIGEGFEVELAANGHEAITLANIVVPDVIVLDLWLPDLDGLEVARHLRTRARTSAIPILIASAVDSAIDSAAVRASGCEGHLLKPFSADALFGHVDALVRRRPDPSQATRLRIKADPR